MQKFALQKLFESDYSTCENKPKIYTFWCFEKYFLQRVPKNEIPDEEIKLIFISIKNKSSEVRESIVIKYIKKYQSKMMLIRLFHSIKYYFIEDIDEEIIQPLCTGIFKYAKDFNYINMEVISLYSFSE